MRQPAHALCELSDSEEPSGYAGRETASFFEEEQVVLTVPYHVYSTVSTTCSFLLEERDSQRYMLHGPPRHNQLSGTSVGLPALLLAWPRLAWVSAVCFPLTSGGFCPSLLFPLSSPSLTGAVIHSVKTQTFEGGGDTGKKRGWFGEWEVASHTHAVPHLCWPSRGCGLPCPPSNCGENLRRKSRMLRDRPPSPPHSLLPAPAFLFPTTLP